MTPRTRELMKRMLRNLIHDGDMFGIVSTGTSSISEQLTYDRQVLESAIKRVTGGGAAGPKEIIKTAAELAGADRAALSRARGVLDRLRADAESREGAEPAKGGASTSAAATTSIRSRRRGSKSRREAVRRRPSDLQCDPFTNQQMQGQQFAEADLVRELAELTRAANRANATHLHDRSARPGRRAGSRSSRSTPQEWQDYVRETQDSLRVLAEETGGIAVVNQNDFDKALKRIDNETSDYYVLGYYSTNPDPLKRTRQHRSQDDERERSVKVWSRTRCASLQAGPR